LPSASPSHRSWRRSSRPPSAGMGWEEAQELIRTLSGNSLRQRSIRRPLQRTGTIPAAPSWSWRKKGRGCFDFCRTLQWANEPIHDLLLYTYTPYISTQTQSIDTSPFLSSTFVALRVVGPSPTLSFTTDQHGRNENNTRIPLVRSFPGKISKLHFPKKPYKNIIMTYEVLKNQKETMHTHNVSNIYTHHHNIRDFKPLYKKS
jgi:hypothetical protein